MEARLARQQEADRLARRLEFLASQLKAIRDDWPVDAQTERRRHLLTGIEAMRLRLKNLEQKGIRLKPPGKADAANRL